MRYVAAVAALAVLSVNPWPAHGHLAYKPNGESLEARERVQQRNTYHSRYVCAHGAGAAKRWHCKAKVWLARELAETREQLRRHTSAPIRSTGDGCLDEIIRRETAGTWDHTIWNYQGSGAYGLPQALPGRKMASAGADWRTNPWTQVRWMRGYVNARYGGSCSALSFHNANGYY